MSEKITDEEYKPEYWEEFKKQQDGTEKKMMEKIKEMIETKNLNWIQGTFATVLWQHNGLLNFLDTQGEIMPLWQQREIKYAIESTRRMLHALIDAAHKIGYRGPLAGVIPSSWKDEQFWEDEKNAKIVTLADNRPYFCGSAASESFCREHGIEPFKEEEAVDYYRLFQAVIDLLDRRGVIAKEQRKEYTP